MTEPLTGQFLNYLQSEKRYSPHTLDGYRRDLQQLALQLDGGLLTPSRYARPSPRPIERDSTEEVCSEGSRLYADSTPGWPRKRALRIILPLE
jgi:hypothetical protein